jgi:hypothetical protein
LPRPIGERKSVIERNQSGLNLSAKILTSLRSSDNGGVLVSGADQFLCIVKDGEIKVLLPESEAGNVVRLTEMPMQKAVAPEVQEISVKKHEGKAIMVEGRSSNGWIYSAELIDTAGPILSASVQKVFSR